MSPAQAAAIEVVDCELRLLVVRDALSGLTILAGEASDLPSGPQLAALVTCIAHYLPEKVQQGTLRS